MKPGFDKTRYEIVLEDEKRISLSNDSTTTLLEDGLGEQARTRHVRKTPRWMWYTHVALFSISAALFVSSWFGQPTNEAFVQKFASWSPALEAVEYSTVQYNVSRMGSPIYTGANDAVDAAWNALAFDIGDQMISHEQMKTLGKPMDSLGVANPKTGEHGFRIGLEVFHQLHCLNFLRKITYKEHYDPLGGDLADPPKKLRVHLDHCIEILRLNLMCSSDVGVITFHEMPGYDGPWPDFSTKHVCRNYDNIRTWAIENTVATDNI